MTQARWFYVENEARLGPVDFEQLMNLLSSGTLPPDTLVWHHGMKAWSEAQDIPEIAEQLPPPLPPGGAPPPEMPPPIPARAKPASVEPVLMVEPDEEPAEPFKLHAVEKSGGKAPAPSSDPAPIPVLSVDEPFEIERAGEYAVPARVSRPAPAPAKEPPPKPAAAPAKEIAAKEPAIKPPPPAKEPAAKEPPAVRPPASAAAPPAAKGSPTPTLPLIHPPRAGGAAAPEPRPAPTPAIIGIPAAPAPPPVPAIIGMPAVADAPAVAPPPIPTARAAGSAAAKPHTVAWPNGRLADHDFPDLVREVYSQTWSGLMTLNHMGVEKSVRVHEGRLVFASSSSRDDRLGELLLRKGRISLHQFVAASRAIRKNKRLGTILVEEGALDPRELVKVVTEHTQEIIYSAFQWTEGMYHFTAGDASPEEITLKLSTPDIIMEGVRRVEAWSRIERGVGNMDTRYTRDEHFDKILPQLNLSIEKLSILTGLTAVKDVGTLCRESNLSHFEVCRTLWAFRVIGVVRRLS
jgi:hypothetical protein